MPARVGFKESNKTIMRRQPWLTHRRTTDHPVGLLKRHDASGPDERHHLGDNLFGLGHIDQGITGQVENMIDGCLLGVIFLATGCNLWAAIIAHGVTDTLDIVMLYLGKYPGM